MDVDKPHEAHPVRFGATMPMASIRLCVVYDADSGHIHHHHSVLTLVGGSELSLQQIALDALQACGLRRTPVHGNLRVLHVDHAAITPGHRYRVNDGTLCLVPR